MLNKQELITAFQEFVDNRLIPGKWENDKRRVYSIIIDDVRIENLNKFIKNHFTNTERSAWWTFKQVTSNYVDAASYFDDHEISLMFYTCFSYRVVYQIQHKNWGISSDYFRSNSQIQSCWMYSDTKYLDFNSEWNKIIPATPNNYYIPQHFDITATNLGGFEEPMDKTLKKARSIYTRLYNLNIINSIEEYKNLINSIDDFREKEVKCPRFVKFFLFVFLWVGLFFIIWIIFAALLSNLLDYIGLNDMIAWLAIIFSVIWFPVIWYFVRKNKRSSYELGLKHEQSKVKLKNELLKICDFLSTCFYSSKNDELLSKLEEYENIFNEKNITILHKEYDGWREKTETWNEKINFDKYVSLPVFKKLEDTYKHIKENIEEWWKISWWKSINDEYNDKLWWDYDINSAKEKFADDEEL